MEQLEQERLNLAPEAMPTSDKAVKKADKQLKKRHDNETDTDYKLFISAEILKKMSIETCGCRK